MAADLERFIAAQAPVLQAVEGELARGAKQSHWMWFVFPQIEGLGHNAMARRYALASLDEARAYAAHPLLGARLRAWTGLVLAHAGVSARAIFGTPDDLKFRSSMTLFARAVPDEPLFRAALDAFYAGREDEATLQRL
jgi:uncharacterized protein (DUF1810 family)